MPVTVEREAFPPLPPFTTNVSCPVGTWTQVDESPYLTPVVTAFPLALIPALTVKNSDLVKRFSGQCYVPSLSWQMHMLVSMKNDNDNEK